MTSVIAKRMTAQIEREVIVFLIGMRINRVWKLHKWLPVARAMPRMLRELRATPVSGLLGFHTWIGNPTITLQYWRSFEDLEHYAKDPGHVHRSAWAAFNRAIASNGDVGIWHETYRARAGEYESVYLNMPAFGLGKAAGLREAVGHRVSAAGRLSERPTATATPATAEG